MDEMTPTETTTTILRQFNEWRRGDDETIEQPDPHEVSEAIDAAVEMIERMDEALESLLIRCDDSDSAMYGTLSTSFVRDTVRIARAALEKSK